MYSISKEFTFSASHRLTHLPETHPCYRLHGHNYVVIVELSSRYLDSKYFVVDYREFDEIKKFLDTRFDHRHLNDVMMIPPTAENIARGIYQQFKPRFPSLSSVSVQETPKTKATYHGTDS